MVVIASQTDLAAQVRDGASEPKLVRPISTLELISMCSSQTDTLRWVAVTIA